MKFLVNHYNTGRTYKYCNSKSEADILAKELSKRHNDFYYVVPAYFPTTLTTAINGAL